MQGLAASATQTASKRRVRPADVDSPPMGPWDIGERRSTRPTYGAIACRSGAGRQSGLNPGGGHSLRRSRALQEVLDRLLLLLLHLHLLRRPVALPAVSVHFSLVIDMNNGRTP